MKYTKEQLIDFAYYCCDQTLSLSKEDVEALFEVWLYNKSVKNQEFQDREENWFGAEDKDLEDNDLRYNDNNN